MRPPILASLRMGKMMQLKIFVWSWLVGLSLISSDAFCASISDNDDVGCTCADKRLRSGYLTRSMIESRHALAILQKIDAGNIAGVKSLASEIMKGSKAEIRLLLNQEVTKEETRLAQKIIDDIDAYLHQIDSEGNEREIN